MAGISLTDLVETVDVADEDILLIRQGTEDKKIRAGVVIFSLDKYTDYQKLGTGFWVSGSTFTAYDQYMVYEGKAYTPSPSTTLPYTVGAIPNTFTYQIKLDVYGENSISITTTALISSSIEFGVDAIVETIGFLAKGDGGGDKWQKTATTGTPSQTPAQLGYALLNDSIGFQWKLIYKGNLNLRSIGGFPEVDSNLVLVAAANSVKETNKYIIVDEVLTATDNQKALSDCIFIGNGSISGVYRKNVFRQTNSIRAAYNPAIRLNQIARITKAKPTIVLAGDSISTYSANSRARFGMLTDEVERLCLREFGECNYYNRAVAGQTYSSFDGIPSGVAGVEWYTDVGKQWLSYIEDLQPDCLFISFGMNDQAIIDTDAMTSIRNKILAFKKPCSIVFLTNLVPSLSGSKANLFAFRSEQEGRDYAAGYTRTFADYYGHGLIDINRQNNIIRDGLDVVGGKLGNRESIAPVDNALTGSKECYNFKIGVVFNESLMIDSSSVYFDIPLGNTDFAKVRVRNAGGFYRFIVFTGSDSGSTNNTDIYSTTEVVGAASRKMSIEVSGGKFTAYREDDDLGANTDPIVTFKVIRGGGLIYPRVLTNNFAGLSTSTFDYGNGFTQTPTVSDSDLWGYLSDPANIGVWGGSGWNHPSTLVSSSIYQPMLANVMLKSSAQTGLNLGDVIYTTGVVATNATSATGAPYFNTLNLSSSIQQQACFDVKNAIRFKSVVFKYISDNSGGSDIVIDMSAVSTQVGGLSSRDNIIVNPLTINVDGSNITTTVVTLSNYKYLNKGDQVYLWRNTASASDTYGVLKLISVDFI
jgi:hypothetical protein